MSTSKAKATSGMDTAGHLWVGGDTSSRWGAWWESGVAELRRMRQEFPELWMGGWLCLGFALVFLGLLGWDERRLLGIHVWVKPLKFALSTWIYLWTMGILLRGVQTSKRSFSWIRWSFALTMLIEVVAVGMQSLRGVTSHFNNSTPLDGMIFSFMGLTIVWNTLIVVWVGVLLGRKGSVTEALKVRRSYLWGIRWGVAIFLAGSLVGGVMARVLSHSIGGVDGGAGLFFVNWSVTHGDLRVAHFFGLHALQLLPLVGWWLERNASATSEGKEKVWLVHLVALGYAGFVVWCFVQAIMGKPLWAFS